MRFRAAYLSLACTVNATCFTLLVPSFLRPMVISFALCRYFLEMRAISGLMVAENSKCVTLCGHIGKNGVDAVCKSHVQHFVRFVHNHVLDGGEGHGFAFHQVQQSSGCGYDDVYPPFQGAYLAFDGRTAVYGQYPQTVDVLGVIVQVACYL